MDVITYRNLAGGSSATRSRSGTAGFARNVIEHLETLLGRAMLNSVVEVLNFLPHAWSAFRREDGEAMSAVRREPTEQ